MTAQAKPKLALRPFLPADAPLLAEIFRASVAELTGDDYSAGQQEAWASMADDEAAFAARIDMLYVHPAAAGQGVGTMLIDALEKLAGSRGAARLTADVSDSAQEFFKRRGFAAKQRNSVPLGNEWLANTTMEKRLAAKERAQ